MQVICIHGVKAGDMAHDDFGRMPKILPEEVIYEGENYTVESSMWVGDILYYSLTEKPPGMYYGANRFIPLSNISETELYSQPEKILEAK